MPTLSSLILRAIPYNNFVFQMRPVRVNGLIRTTLVVTDRAEKPQQADRCWSSGCMVLEGLWGDTPHPGAKDKTQQHGRRGEITFRVKPHTCQRRSEGSNKPRAHQRPETPQRLRQNCVWACLVEVQVSSGLPQGRSSGCSRLGYCIDPLGGGHDWPHHSTARTYTGLGK